MSKRLGDEIHRRTKGGKLGEGRKCVNGTALEYLSSLLQYYSCPRDGIQSAKDTLRMSLCDRALFVAGPRIWNDQPRHIREGSSIVFQADFEDPPFQSCISLLKCSTFLSWLARGALSL